MLAEALEELSGVLKAGSLSQAASGRSREQVHAALVEWLGAEPHEEIIEFFTFAEQWVDTTIAPNVVLRRFDEPDSRESYVEASHEPWDEGHGASDGAGNAETPLDWIWAGVDHSGNRYAFAPASGGGAVPRVLQHSPGTFGMYVADRDGRASTLVTDWQELPSLAEWGSAVLEGHRSGAIVIADGTSRPSDVTPSTTVRWSYPWPPPVPHLPKTGPRLESTFTLERSRVKALALSPDHSQLMTGDHDGLIELWNPADGERLGGFASEYKGVRAVEWSPDGTAVVVTGDLGGSTCWVLASGQTRWTLAEGQVVPSPDHNTLLVTKYGDKARLWDVESQALAYESEPNVEYSQGFSATGEYVALIGAARGRSSGDLYIISTATGEVVFESSLRGTGEQHWAWGGGWSSNGHFAFAAGPEALMFDVDTQQVRAAPTGFRSLVSGMRWSPDGRHLVVIHQDDSIEVCSFDDHGQSADLVPLHATGIPFAKLARGARLNGTISWAPDSARLVSTLSTDRAGRIFDVASGEAEHLLQALPEWLGQLAWSPSGHLLISQSIGETHIWDASSGTNLHLLSEPCASKAAVWGPDDTYLIGLDSIVGRWDVR